ncbi:phage terminase large subunit [Clostridium botulinum]|uniref:phage terminase large subunit n=1 Tax=Clostridium botulinum TaxID=1491 RepID=UPI001E30F2C8|nr:phage terminase large subunit [Clostridium botulinum]MCD3254375.1 phage terminase large subunit [Clostridium botulinum C/D]MCD3279875.1 phage terminase large subunit [Clostridium botulinum C/D]MCD3339606.1 phage terminase large subunit [Clostridium botulinum C/D]MCD3357514.1 phage terminase large subunit [Clostridium botulinum C/D]
MDKNKKLKLLDLLRQKAIIDSRKSFWIFCKTIAPDFYKEDRKFLKDLCNTLQNVYERKYINKNTNKPYNYLALSIPPRHGKSRTVGLFTAWCLGVDRTKSIMTASYNESIGTIFSRNCRDLILEKSSEGKIVFSDIFPETVIKKGNSAVNDWTIEGGYNSYYGGGFGSSFTGRGADILIVDDPIKNAEEALNDATLEKIYMQYTDTLMSRIEGDGIIIVIQTRWNKKDLIGRVLSADKDNWLEINLKAYDETRKGKNQDDNMLCSEILPYSKYCMLKSQMSDLIFMANYQQITIDVKGALYHNLKKYEDLPIDDEGKSLFENIVCFVDTADTGSDYLCAIVAGVYKHQLYILDLVYTQERMEITEGLVSDLLYRNKVNVCIVESNNGGKGFARRLQDLQIEKYKTNHTVIKWKSQTSNKRTRILMASAWIEENVFFPINIKDKFEEFWEHILTFSKDGKNKHDDAEDCLTALAENFGDGIKPIQKATSIKISGI